MAMLNNQRVIIMTCKIGIIISWPTKTTTCRFSGVINLKNHGEAHPVDMDSLVVTRVARKTSNEGPKVCARKNRAHGPGPFFFHIVGVRGCNFRWSITSNRPTSRGWFWITSGYQGHQYRMVPPFERAIAFSWCVRANNFNNSQHGFCWWYLELVFQFHYGL